MTSFVDFLKEEFGILSEDATGDASGATNVVGNDVATMAVPIAFTRRKWGKVTEYVVSHEDYQKLSNMSKMAKGKHWEESVHPDLKKALKKTLYEEESALVTHEKHGKSIILRNKKKKREQFANDELASCGE